MTSKEKTKMYGVSIHALKIATVQEYAFCNDDSSKLDWISKLAMKYNSVGCVIINNHLHFLFLVDNERKMFYNDVKKKVRCRLLKRPVKVERTMLEGESAKA